MDIKALAAAAAAAGALQDQTKATVGGGGDYTPPAAGDCKLRFVAYVEIGKQEHNYQGVKSFKDKVLLVFELSGPNHPAKVLEDGTKVPQRITIEENLSLNTKAHFYKLFTRMNYQGKATNMAELLGEAYKGRIVHRKFPKRGEPKDDPTKHTGIDAELFDKATSSYTIVPPRYEEQVEGIGTGVFHPIAVDPAISESKAFFWNYQPDLSQWDSLYIPGEYPERKNDKTGEVIAPPKSKNVLQNRIKLANNFAASPIYILLASHGKGLDIPDAESGRDESMTSTPDAEDTKPVNAAPVIPEGEAAVDALNDIV